MRSFFRLVSAAPAPRIAVLGSGRAVAIEVEEEKEAEEAPAPPDHLAAAKQHLVAIQPPAEPASAEEEQRCLKQAWLLGQALAALKRQAGHGRWLALLATEFPLLSHQNAGRYVRFFCANSLPSTTGEKGVPTSFSPESIRRLRWNYVPAKERPSSDAAGAVATRQRLVERRVVSALQCLETLLNRGQLGDEAAAVEVLRQASKTVIQLITKFLGREFILELLAQPTDQDPEGR